MCRKSIALAYSIADSAARADIETMCTYVTDCLFHPQNAEEFRAAWIDVSRVVDKNDHQHVRIALEYLELRKMLTRHESNPTWLRVIEHNTLRTA